MEVPVGLHPASPRAESLGGTPRQYDGIVDGGGEFTLGDQPGVGQRVASGAGDLRGAAHGVGVLDPGGVVLVMPRQPRTLQYGEHVGGAGGLAGVRADGVQFGGEHLVGAEEGFQAEGGRDIGGLVEAVQIGEGHDQHAEHAVGAVEESEPLLLAQLDGVDAVFGEQVTGRPHGPVGALGVPLAHQREGAVGERGQVAGAAQGAVLVDDRGDPGVEHVGHRARDLGADPGAAGADGLQPEEHQGPDDFPLDAGAHARGVRTDDVALQLSTQLRADVPGRQGAEAGAHPVDGVRLGGQGVHDLAGRGEGGHRLRGQFDAGPAARHGEHIGRGHARGPHHHSVHIHIQERTQ